MFGFPSYAKYSSLFFPVIQSFIINIIDFFIVWNFLFIVLFSFIIVFRFIIYIIFFFWIFPLLMFFTLRFYFRFHPPKYVYFLHWALYAIFYIYLLVISPTKIAVFFLPFIALNCDNFPIFFKIICIKDPNKQRQ